MKNFKYLIKKMKVLFYFLLHLLINNNIKSKKIPSIDSDTAQIILHQNKLFYITNDLDDDKIHIQDLSSSSSDEETVNVSSNIKINKRLISLNEEKFILLGFDSDGSSSSKLSYEIYNSIQYKNVYKKGEFGISYKEKINFKIVNATMVLSYFFEQSYLSIHRLYIDDTNPNLEQKYYFNIDVSSGFTLNTVECESFDGENILCVYSLISGTNIMYYYFFNDNANINQINNLYPEIYAVSINKLLINNMKEFIMCFVDILDSKYQLRCQTFLESNSQLFYDSIYPIDEKLDYSISNNNYIDNIPIKIVIYKYTIYILTELSVNNFQKNAPLYSCSLDFGLRIKSYTKIIFKNFKDTNILVDSNNIIIDERIQADTITNTDAITNIYYLTFNYNCSNFELQFSSINKDDGMDISSHFNSNNYLINKNISFSLDKKTFLQIKNRRNYGGLNEEIEIKPNIKFELKYSYTLQLTDNYYIIYSKDYTYTPTGTTINYSPASHYCYFKVINCYETCEECYNNIFGTSENHQCHECIPSYYKLYNSQNEEGYYNCYQVGDPKIPKNMYLENNKEFKDCHKSCKECSGTSTNCKSCNMGYYFKVNEFNHNIISDNTCHSDEPEYHYLNISSNISHNNEIVKFVYKPCHSTCKTCFGDGTTNNNNCIECRGDNIKYPFDERRCTFNKDNCNIWFVDDNKNIQCSPDCDGYLIKNVTNNLNQCVKNCHNFVNPYSEYLSLLSFECGGEKVCITVDDCKNRNLTYDNEKCYPDGDNCFYVPRTTMPEESAIPLTQEPTQAPKLIENRVTLIKTFEVKKNYSEVKDNKFKENQFRDYKDELNDELKIGRYLNGIDFITFSKYKDFNITIYPLETEEYVKQNLLDLNNFCYINFTKFFQNYELQDENLQILIALIEHKNDNLPINTVNYFFMLFNKINFNGEVITNLTNGNNYLDISYPLYNYEHENISAKYSTELINTIKELNDIDENFNFFEQNNSFYNDICYSYTFDKDIDITIKDRIKEYYIEISFCENGCSFKYIYDKDKNPKSLCECKLKEVLDITEANYSFNTTTKEKESVSNFKALSCYNEVFSSELSSNPSFWIYLIMVFIHIALFIGIIFCAKQAIEKMLKSKKENIINLENNNTNINNNENLNNPNNIFHNKNNNVNNIIKEDKAEEDELKINKNKNIKMSGVSKNSKVSNSIKESDNNLEDNESKEYKSSKKESFESNPPKKNQTNKSRETTSIIPNSSNNKQTKNENETFLVESEINYNFDKDSGFEDIFDDIGNTTSKVNNYILDEKNIKKDNYIYLEKKQLFGKLKQSLAPLDKKVFNKYKYINTVNEINDAKQVGNINITGFDLIKKEHYSMDDIKIDPKNLNLINYSDIKNKGQKLSKFSKLFGEESILSGNEKFLQAGNNLINNKNGEKYEKDLKENNNKNDNYSDISEKNVSGQLNNLYKKKKKASDNSSYGNSERNKLKNSLNSSINSNDKLIAKRNIKNQKEEKEQNKSKEEKEEIIYKKQNVLSSLESEIDDSILDTEKQKSLCYFYCDYFVKRELFLLTFYHKQDNVSIFIRLPTFFVSISFIFTIICLFLTEKDIHKRYEYYNNHGGKINEFNYAFNNNLLNCFIIALISIVFKMICIKLVYFVAFNVPDKIKEEMTNKEQKNLSQLEVIQKSSKKKKYFKTYKRRSIIFMIIILILLIVFAYISICYCGIFKHSFIGILINFVIAIIFSFIICAFLCFIVSIFYRCGCFSIFKVLKVIY